MIPPLRIASPRMVLRCWTPDLAPLLREALEVTWDDLQRWIPWVFPELEDIPVLRERLAGYEEDFRTGGNALYAVMDPAEGEVWGGAGLYRRIGPSAAIPRKLGYRHRETLVASGCTPAEEAGHTDQDTMIWEMTAETFAAGDHS